MASFGEFFGSFWRTLGSFRGTFRQFLENFIEVFGEHSCNSQELSSGSLLRTFIQFYGNF